VTAFTGTDRFEVRRCLGSGSFGVVYEAFDRERRLRVALKLPHAGSAQGLYRFKQEFRALADVNHLNLATLFELLMDGERWFFTMELVEGRHLLDYLRSPGGGPGSGSIPDTPTGTREPREGTGGELSSVLPLLPSAPPDFGRVRRALRQLTEGLLALHGAGMLHRDLKPSNVLVTRDGRVVILDFGLVMDLGGTDLWEGGLAGTPSYMSPEQAQGCPATAASDWYSVGVLLYQTLTGRLPFAGSSPAILAQKLQQEPLEPRYLVPGTPQDLEELCMGLLRKDPIARLQGKGILDRLQEPFQTSLPVASEPGGRELAFVGREEELAALLEGFEQVRGGRTVVALLHGDSGSGKTALAQMFQREVRLRVERAVVLQGRCYEQETVPFKALDSLVDALSQHLVRLSPLEAGTLLPSQIQALARLFPVLGQVPLIAEQPQASEIPDAQEFRRRAFGALRELLRRLALRGPLALVIDDLQWGDLDSAALLEELLRPPDPPRILLLLCYRTEEARSSPLLQELLPSLARSGSFLDVELHALSRSVARKLAKALLGPGQAGDEEQADWIAAESGGSPFFVQELACHMRRMDLDDRPGRCLEDYLRIRIDALPAEARRILQTLAIAGYPLDWELLQQAAGVEDASIALLSGLRTEHLLRMRASARRRILETYHDRIRVALVQTADPDRVRNVNLALANALEARGSTDAQALARHFEAAALPAKASGYAVQAAGQAETALAFDQAAAHYRKAIVLRDSRDPDVPALWKRLGDALANAGRSAEAAEAYLQAAAGAAAPEVNRLHRRAAEEYLRSGNLAAGLEILQRLLALAGAHLPGGRLGAVASVLWNRLRLRLRGLGFQECTADQIPPGELERVDTFWAVAMGLGPVDVLRAADFQARQLLLTLKLGEPFRVVRALAHETLLVAAAGNRSLERTHRLVAGTTALAERIGHPNPRARALMAAGIADTMQGRWRSSAARLERVEELLKQNCTGMGYELHLAQHNGLLARLVLGDLPLIQERLPALLQEAREQGNLIATTNLRVSLSPILSLAQDAPETARTELKAAIAAWPHGDFHLQHYHHLVSRVAIDLYEGAFGEAFAAVEAAEEGLQRSMLLRLQPILVTFLELRARAALAQAFRAGAPGHAVASARRDMRRLLAERTAYGGALALKLQAMEALLAGRRDEALARLRRAEQTFDACDMPLHLLASRSVRGRLEGNLELQQSACAELTGKGIVNPARFAAMHVPVPG